MSRSLFWWWVSICLVLPVCGCYQTAESPTEEQKNPHFMVGKERVSSRDYRGAIEAFERALEVNPRYVLSHFELGLLYELHDDSDNHLIAAMYHYKRVLDLRPNIYPAENARMRMAGCKQELVKSESVAPVYQTMQRDLEKLKEENKQLRGQLEAWHVPAGTTKPPPQPGNTVTPLPSGPARGQILTPVTASAPSANTAGNRVTPLPPSGSPRSYIVLPGDTFASIARNQKVSLTSLQSANPGVTPKKLKPGQSIVLPAN